MHCDPDIFWQLKNKGRDYSGMNAVNISAITNFLMQSGNTKAEFIPAINNVFKVKVELKYKLQLLFFYKRIVLG
ncbi:hypothetical protein IX38_20470 [Chryseobacterium luteum]|uniref:Uncharacterized protein n=1 Tax=Chryseobacterium luteum TaxID=421531 RepID=A0A085YZM7_9FLAO|nr:hypothetical protein IX38_20470 [Chryseobacterium luteum]